jgi:hypothetical protein
MTRGDAAAVATSLATANTIIGNALAIANSEAIGGPGKGAVARSLAQASSVVGDATAVANAAARG